MSHGHRTAAHGDGSPAHATVPGTKRMQPLSIVESSMANQSVAVRVSGVSGQYAMSWCQANTASSLNGCLARSWS